MTLARGWLLDHIRRARDADAEQERALTRVCIADLLGVRPEAVQLYAGTPGVFEVDGLFFARPKSMQGGIAVWCVHPSVQDQKGRTVPHWRGPLHSKFQLLEVQFADYAGELGPVATGAWGSPAY